MPDTSLTLGFLFFYFTFFVCFMNHSLTQILRGNPVVYRLLWVNFREQQFYRWLPVSVPDTRLKPSQRHAPLSGAPTSPGLLKVFSRTQGQRKERQEDRRPHQEVTAQKQISSGVSVGQE